MIRSKRLFIALVATAIFSLSTATALYASPVVKTIRAQFLGIRFSYNGKIVNPGANEPFIVDQTTYVPIRMVGELVGKNVQWDGANKLILINDTVDQSVVQKDLEIIQLKSEIDSLKKELEQAKTGTKTEDKNDDKKDDKKDDKSLKELEKDINDDYGKLKNVVFEITLRGDEREIEVEIETDLYRYQKYWDKLDEKDLEKHIKELCEDIWEVYDKAKITGDLYDVDEREYLLEFTSDSRRRLAFDYVNKLDVSKLEYDLDKKYDTYLPNIYTVLEINGDEKDLEFRIHVDYDYFESEWYALSDDQVKAMMSKIYDDIRKSAPDARIEGYIYDTSTRSVIARYRRTDRGNAVFEAYY